MNNIISRTSFASAPLLAAGNNTVFCYNHPEFFAPCATLLGVQSVAENRMSPLCRTLCRVVFTYAMRIGEALRLLCTDVLSGDRVLVRGEKKSASYIILLPGIYADMVRAGVVDKAVSIFPLSYLQCYRSALRAGISFFRNDHKNRILWHRGRFALIEEITLGHTDLRAGDLLRHRHENTVQYYMPLKGGSYG